MSKNCPRAKKQVLKVARNVKKLSIGNKTKFKKSSEVAKNCPR